MIRIVNCRDNYLNTIALPVTIVATISVMVGLRVFQLGGFSVPVLLAILGIVGFSSFWPQAASVFFVFPLWFCGWKLRKVE